MANLNEMTREQLLKHRDDVDVALKSLEERRYTDAKAAAEEAAAKHGLSLQDIYAGRVGNLTISGSKKAFKAPKTPHPAKYRHPEDHSLTYSGKARKPKWFTELLDKGYTEEQLLIENQKAS